MDFGSIFTSSASGSAGRCVHGRALRCPTFKLRSSSVASKLATEEFPQFDVGQRSAASMARRLQDPLAELVKIDPKSIGVGQYQHDMNQKKLTEALDHVVEDCVNRVGVDLNTASASLLEYVSGVSKAIAKNIVVYREENGKFASRSQLLKVAKLGPKAYEQCAGFMRISDGKKPSGCHRCTPGILRSHETAAGNTRLYAFGCDRPQCCRDWKIP